MKNHSSLFFWGALTVMSLVSGILLYVIERAHFYNIPDTFVFLSQRKPQITLEKFFNSQDPRCFSFEQIESENHTTERLTLSLVEGVLVGEKRGTTQGLEYSAGYEGTLLGTFVDNSIHMVYTYTVDGANQRQEERYTLRDGVLVEEKYRLIDDFENNILVIDPDVKVGDKEYQEIECE